MCTRIQLGGMGMESRLRNNSSEIYHFMVYTRWEFAVALQHPNVYTAECGLQPAAYVKVYDVNLKK
jgi:hypothetical protein